VSEATARETLIFTIARLLEGVRHVAVGASSPIPAAGAMLLRALAEGRGGEPVRISILGSADHNFFTQGAGELFDCAAQGRIDAFFLGGGQIDGAGNINLVAFFLGGGQIDGAGNINLVGSGDYPNSDVRWPGSFGSAFLYYVVPRVILFREEHSPRVLVEKVDFISAPGTSPAGIYRVGGPYALLTGAALFAFEKDRGRFRLESVHPGHTVEGINASTGFSFASAPTVGTTPKPDQATLALLRGRVLDELAETYPQFAELLHADAVGNAA
jgi:glutaconate CoA-transferase subunit B